METNYYHTQGLQPGLYETHPGVPSFQHTHLTISEAIRKCPKDLAKAIQDVHECREIAARSLQPDLIHYGFIEAIQKNHDRLEEILMIYLKARWQGKKLKELPKPK